MNIQIIKQFTNRTEYKMLKGWIDVDEQNIDELMPGVCVIPTIILLKLSDVELQSLNKWWRQWGNQLIVSPPFHQIDVALLLQLNVALSVQAIETQSFNSLPVIEAIKTNSKSKWQLARGEIVAVDHYEHSGSGCVTLTTIPLLDYRLLSQQEACKKMFLELINEKFSKETATAQKSFILNSVHEHIIILASANVLNPTKLSEQLSYYFKEELSQNEALELFRQLTNKNFIEITGVITDIGEKHINFKGYRAFVREIRRWRRDNREWR
ncbi:hypothetical protein ACEPPU_14505 [Priestia aryabhattai]|uniref:hypothetical protein n=1 Tax=Priestia aryabhattai TaxID=412384 RepID=UPI0035ABE206